tara:strand:- start:294 stop:1214 length:921 start_codon:yes stop_codon:yes gene_type:complete
MNKIKKLIILIIFLVHPTILMSNEIKIIKIVGNEIITNIDLKNQIVFLTSLNEKLANVEKKKLNSFALNSLVNEKIKLIEIQKFFEIEKEDEYVKSSFEMFLKNNNFKSENDFINFVKTNSLILENIKESIKIEAYWNKLIFEKFNYQVDINIKKINNNLKKISNDALQNEYNLSEIIFSAKDKLEFEEKSKKIYQSIEIDGFESSAIIYNENTLNKKGNIGWISESQLNEKINKSLKNMKIQEVTKPIQISNGFLILKLNESRKTKKVIDISKEKEKMILKEKNNQLNQFSTLYFNKISKNAEIK